MDIHLKVKDILYKLKELRCPLDHSSDNTWLTEILFKPSFERYKLIGWILSKLNIPVLDMFKNQSSVECKIQNLQAILSALGVCSENDNDIIEGTAVQSKQLEFWELLLGTLLNKARLIGADSENCDSSNGIHRRNVSNEYTNNCDFESKICESVNISHLFSTKLQLLPSYLEKEINTSLEESDSFPACTEDFQKQISEGDYDFDVPVNCGIENISLKMTGQEEFLLSEVEGTLTELEANTAQFLNNLENYSNTSFKDAYYNLKPYLSDISTKEFTGMGTAFKATEKKLESIIQIKNSSALLKSSDLDLEKVSCDVSKFLIPPGLLSDTHVGEYITIISEAKQKE